MKSDSCENIQENSELLIMDDCVRDEPRAKFSAREGVYNLLNYRDVSSTSRLGFVNNCNGLSSLVKVSFVSMPNSSNACERVCFNRGRELFVYVYNTSRKCVDSSYTLDKRVYKSTMPTCHDFCSSCTASSAGACLLLVGFASGQIQLIDTLTQNVNHIFNEDQSIDRTRVTCVCWLPNSDRYFAVTHASGHFYVYCTRLQSHSSACTYHTVSTGAGHTFERNACGSANPLTRWTVGTAPAHCVNSFAFSPTHSHIAFVTQRGCMRVFGGAFASSGSCSSQHALATTLCAAQPCGMVRSYFGAFTCLAWSPDGSYVALGGEDDLVTVWSVVVRRVLLRCRGHRSWVSSVAFDTHQCSGDTYRLASVGQDTRLCLWDIGVRELQSMAAHTNNTQTLAPSVGARHEAAQGAVGTTAPGDKHFESRTTRASRRFGMLLAGRRIEKCLRVGVATLGAAHSTNHLSPCAMTSQPLCDDVTDDEQLIGTASCPRLGECVWLEPHIVVRVAQERLTYVAFRPDCLITACTEGFVYCWLRPGVSADTQSDGSIMHPASLPSAAAVGTAATPAHHLQNSTACYAGESQRTTIV